MTVNSSHVMLIEVPLCPLWVPWESTPRQSRRQRPADSLNLPALSKSLQPNIMGFLPIDESRWSVTAVLSPYSFDVHVMVIESSPFLYRPGPERVPEKEGEDVIWLCGKIVEHIRKCSPDANVNLGYNWSARSWGRFEERTGFASIPTKWHTQIWTWPIHLESPHAHRVKVSDINFMERRLILENDYGVIMGRIFRDKIVLRFGGDSLFAQLFLQTEPVVDCRGVVFNSKRQLPEILGIRGVFSSVIKPLGELLSNILKHLTEMFTDIDCDSIDSLLASIEKNSSVDLSGMLQILRRTPVMREKKDILLAFDKTGYPRELMDVLLEPVCRRCYEEGDNLLWWRKGFGYAVAFSDMPGKGTILRIMPGVYIGVGGVVEALGVVLRRPEDRTLPEPIIRARGEKVYQLSRELSKSVKGYVICAD